MPGAGIGRWGPAGGVSGPPTGYSLADFDFQVKALSIGSSIKITFTTPALSYAPEWDRRLRILRKQGEWPRSWDDADAVVSVDDVFPGPAEADHEYTETDLVPGQIYYYAMYELRTDGAWILDTVEGRRSAYPYDRWGFAEYLYNSFPRGWRRADSRNDNHFLKFISIFGALLDNMKTDTEHLLSLFSIDDIHIDLLPLLDQKLGWPTWFAAPGLQQRQDTSRAVGLYKILGRTLAYERIFEWPTSWDCEVVQGWKYVFFSNGKYGSTTPDLSTVAKQDEIKSKMGHIDDLLKYTNHNTFWHSVSGLGFFLTKIPGVSAEITMEMIYRCWELLNFGMATYVNPHLMLVMYDEEVMGPPVDDWEGSVSYAEGPFEFTEEDLGYTTGSVRLFQSNDALSVSTDLGDRTFHKDLEYV